MSKFFQTFLILQNVTKNRNTIHKNKIVNPVTRYILASDS